MERLKNMGLKKSFLLLSLSCLAVAFLLLGAVIFLCRGIENHYPLGGVEILSDGSVVPLPSPTVSQQRILAILNIVQTVSCILFPVGGLIVSVFLFYYLKLKQPISCLQNGIMRIQNNDLDFSLPILSNDEMGQLCAAFEEMRSELLKSNRLLWQQAEERKRLNAAFSHDLRNPITVLKGSVKLLRQGIQDEQTIDRLESYTLRIEQYVEASECYSRDMSMKTKSAKYAKMRRGEYQSVICPYGYRKSADGRMEPDEDVAPNVQMIFQWASEGNTAAEITRKLYAMNIPTPGEYRKLKGKGYYNVSRTNGVWSTSTVLRILEDQRYIGTYVIGKRKVKEIGSRHTQLKDESEWFKIPNHHPAIVSVDLFEKANASIKRFSLSNKKLRDYLLRGKVFCGCCDHAMSLRNGAWFYCRHSEVAETLPCHGVRIKMADLEQVVFETIRAQMCPALGIDSNKDKLDLQTVQQAEHEEKLRSIQDSKRHLYEQYALGEIDLETYRTRKAVYDTELVQAKNVHAVITAQTKQIKSDYEIKLKQQEIVQEVGNANMLTKALIDRLINKVYVFPGDRIEIEYATQNFLETKESEKEG